MVAIVTADIKILTVTSSHPLRSVVHEVALVLMACVKMDLLFPLLGHAIFISLLGTMGVIVIAALLILIVQTKNNCCIIAKQNKSVALTASALINRRQNRQTHLATGLAVSRIIMQTTDVIAIVVS